MRMFGIWLGQGFKTFATDSCQFVFCVLLLLHYGNQMSQAEERSKDIKK
jgi:hypothetical protein